MCFKTPLYIPGAVSGPGPPGAARGHPFLVGAGAGAYLKFPRPLTPAKYIERERWMEREEIYVSIMLRGWEG